MFRVKSATGWWSGEGFERRCSSGSSRLALGPFCQVRCIRWVSRGSSSHPLLFAVLLTMGKCSKRRPGWRTSPNDRYPSPGGNVRRNPIVSPFPDSNPAEQSSAFSGHDRIRWASRGGLAPAMKATLWMLAGSPGRLERRSSATWEGRTILISMISFKLWIFYK